MLQDARVQGLSRRYQRGLAGAALIGITGAIGSVAAAEADPVELPTVTVSADRLPDTLPGFPFHSQLIGQAQLARTPNLRLDDVLRQQIPGFSLFRRSNSRTGHPTTQGVSLRNLGPNGSGRTLVLLDGMPLNDPFAGWVPWQRVPIRSIGEIHVTRGGGAGLYGNAALAGTIHLQTPPVQETGGAITSLAGSGDTFEQTLEGAWKGQSLSFGLFGQHAENGGYHLTRGDQRGAVDRVAGSASDILQTKLTWQTGPESRIELSAAGFQESRENGTALTKNSTDALDLSAAWIMSFPALDAELKLQGYYQNRTFASTFSSVNPDRSAETLALDQFHVPSTAAGGSLTWSQRVAQRHRVLLGMDFRWVEGNTQERFRFLEGQSARERLAGGAQRFAGFFLEDAWQVSPRLELIAGARLDSIEQFDGVRREKERGSDITLLDENYPDDRVLKPNGRLGLGFDMTDQMKIRAAGYTGFRQPTLNELYRPFRIGNEITEANPALSAEQLAGIELGFDIEQAGTWKFSLTGFHNRLNDGVGNVTLAEGPGTFTPGGFVPEGGVLRQRRNIDRIEVNGLEAAVEWHASPEWRVQAGYLFSSAEVERSAFAPELEGKRLEQTPEHVATAAIIWEPHGNWAFTLQARFSGSQYEDDLNTQTLAAYALVDFGVHYQPTPRLGLDLRVENLFDSEVETGKSNSGIVSIGPPVQISLAARYQF